MEEILRHSAAGLVCGGEKNCTCRPAGRVHSVRRANKACATHIYNTDRKEHSTLMGHTFHDSGGLGHCQHFNRRLNRLDGTVGKPCLPCISGTGASEYSNEHGCCQKKNLHRLCPPGNLPPVGSMGREAHYSKTSRGFFCSLDCGNTHPDALTQHTAWDNEVADRKGGLRRGYVGRAGRAGTAGRAGGPPRRRRRRGQRRRGSRCPAPGPGEHTTAFL